MRLASPSILAPDIHLTDSLSRSPYLADPISFKYSRLNKAGSIYPLPVTHILPHPTNHLLFYAVFTDGTIMLYSVALDDPPSSFTAPWASEVPSGTKGMYKWRNEVRDGEKDRDKLKLAGKNPLAVWKLPSSSRQGKKKAFLPSAVIMSPAPISSSSHALQNGFAAANPAAANAYGAAAAAAAEQVRKRTTTSAELSKDGKWLGLVGDDGQLKLIDLELERSVPLPCVTCRASD